MELHDCDKLPTLEDLEISAYTRGNPDVQREAEEKSWAQKFDWTKLRRLRINDTRFLSEFVGSLTALKIISLSQEIVPRHFEDLLSEIPGELEKIDICPPRAQNIGGILKHGSTLRSLRIHSFLDRTSTRNPDQDYDEAADKYLWWMTPEKLDTIRNGCPYLETLSIDVRRPKSLPCKLVDSLRSFSRLKTLVLYVHLQQFPSSEWPPAPPAYPKPNFAGAATLFAALRARSPQETPSRLRELNIKHGWCSHFVDIPFPAETWHRHNRVSFVCRLSERDDEAAAGIFTTRCPRLSAEHNAVFNRALRTGEDPVLAIKRGPRGVVPGAVKLAWHGPYLHVDWFAHRQCIYTPGRRNFFKVGVRKSNGEIHRVDCVVDSRREADWFLRMTETYTLLRVLEALDMDF